MPTTAHLRVPEVMLARAGALGTVLAAGPAAIVALVVAGPAEAGAIAVGVLLIGALALAVTPLYRKGSAVGDQAMVAVHMGALGLRLLLGVAIFAALAWLTQVPMTPFAAGVAVGLIASIIAEMVTASRDPRFFWVTSPTTNVQSSASPSRSGTERQCA